MTKAQKMAAELIEKFGKDDALRTAYAFLCSVSKSKKDFYRNVEKHIAETK